MSILLGSYKLKYSTEELEAALAEVNKNANPIYAFIGAVIGALPAIAVFFFYGEMGAVFYIMLALPPLIIGFFAKYTGRTYEISHRISVGVVGAIVHILCCYLFQASPLIYLLAPAAFAIAFTTAKVKLDEIQNWAVAEAKFGKLNIN